ncbi:MAG: hypothetical protein ABIP03_11930 [Aquihabitans sp.]
MSGRIKQNPADIELDIELDAEDRAAIRAFLQRCEVRLSTIHRVATALLSGAGLLVLLPAVERDSVVVVLRSLLTGRTDLAHLLLVVAVAASLAVPFTALWLVVRDLTQFYFHSNHIRRGDAEAFVPRFTLTGLQLPRGEIHPEASVALDELRRTPEAVEILVPSNDAARRRIDTQIAAYGGLGIDATEGDIGRASALFELAASRERGLLEEVTKVEHGMTRHILRMQVIVLRYAKALLALLATAFSAFASAAVVGDKATLAPGDEVWLAAILLAWAPLAIASVTSPVRWLERQLRSEGATHTAVTADPELTKVEQVTVRLALAGYAAAAGAMALVLTQTGLTATGRALGVVAAASASIGLIVSLRSWGGRPRLLHLLRPPIRS